MAGGILSDRLTWLDDALTQTRAWIASEQADIAAESAFLSPGDPDDDFEYAYSATVKRHIERTAATIASLETERTELLAEQARFRAR